MKIYEHRSLGSTGHVKYANANIYDTLLKKYYLFDFSFRKTNAFKNDVEKEIHMKENKTH